MDPRSPSGGYGGSSHWLSAQPKPAAGRLCLGPGTRAGPTPAPFSPRLSGLPPTSSLEQEARGEAPDGFPWGTMRAPELQPRACTAGTRRDAARFPGANGGSSAFFREAGPGRFSSHWLYNVGQVSHQHCLGDLLGFKRLGWGVGRTIRIASDDMREWRYALGRVPVTAPTGPLQPSGGPPDVRESSWSWGFGSLRQPRSFALPQRASVSPLGPWGAASSRPPPRSPALLDLAFQGAQVTAAAAGPLRGRKARPELHPPQPGALLLRYRVGLRDRDCPCRVQTHPLRLPALGRTEGRTLARDKGLRSPGAPRDTVDAPNLWQRAVGPDSRLAAGGGARERTEDLLAPPTASAPHQPARLSHRPQPPPPRGFSWVLLSAY